MSLAHMKAPQIEIRRSAKAKRLRLAVKNTGKIELVVPLNASQTQTLAFLNQHRGWAEEKWLALNLSAAPVGLLASQTLPWRGKEIPLSIRDEPRKNVKVCIDETALIILPERLAEAREQVAQRALYRWVGQWLKDRVAEQVERHAPRYDLNPRQIRVKQMKTRWGSCGPANDININWLLAFAPDSVLEYVVVHELCHIRERNHSKAFWSLVEQHVPGFLTERAWLKNQGRFLMSRFESL